MRISPKGSAGGGEVEIEQGLEKESEEGHTNHQWGEVGLPTGDLEGLAD